MRRLECDRCGKPWRGVEEGGTDKLSDRLWSHVSTTIWKHTTTGIVRESTTSSDLCPGCAGKCKQVMLDSNTE